MLMYCNCFLFCVLALRDFGGRRFVSTVLLLLLLHISVWDPLTVNLVSFGVTGVKYWFSQQNCL